MPTRSAFERPDRDLLRKVGWLASIGPWPLSERGCIGGFDLVCSALWRRNAGAPG